MSSKGRNPSLGGENDVYPTGAWTVHRLFDHLGMRPSGGARWLEPCAGEGSIIRAVSSRPEFEAIQWDAVELRGETTPRLMEAVGDHGRVCIHDFLTLPPESFDGFRDWSMIITNPPYSLAQQFIERCFAIAPHSSIAMLLRLNFLGGAERRAWLSEHMPEVYVLPNRPSFRGDTTDSCEYGWMIWRPEWRKARSGSVRILETTTLDVRKRDKAAALALMEMPAEGLCGSDMESTR